MSGEIASILIIESQPLMRNALRVTLLAEGFGVVESLCDDQMVEAVSKLTPDLILYSVGAPDSDNLEAISLLRKNLLSTSIVAFITGEFPGQEQAALDHGAHLVVKKAISSSALVNALKKLVTKASDITPESK